MNEYINACKEWSFVFIDLIGMRFGWALTSHVYIIGFDCILENSFEDWNGSRFRCEEFVRLIFIFGRLDAPNCLRRSVKNALHFDQLSVEVLVVVQDAVHCNGQPIWCPNQVYGYMDTRVPTALRSGDKESQILNYLLCLVGHSELWGFKLGIDCGISASRFRNVVYIFVSGTKRNCLTRSRKAMGMRRNS